MTRILIVDDKAENLYLLRALLEGNDCAVEEARHGAEALIKARQSPPDLVVSDLLMPVMDGYTLLRHWKADERLKAIPFVVYTATYTESKDERLALDLGADAFILKPAEPDVFTARLQQVLTRSRTTERPAVRVPSGDPETLLKNYGDILIRKLEEKALQLEEANRALREELAERRQAEAESNRLRGESERARQALLGIMEDERRAKEALRQAEERYRTIFENALEGIYQTSLDGTILVANPALARILGYGSPEELIRERRDVACQGYVDPRERERFKRVLESDGAVNGFEYELFRKDGSKIWVAENAHIVCDRAGNVICYEGSMEDITQRKQADAKLKEQLEELQRWHDAMVGREARVLELKHEVNALLARLGEPARYPSAEEGA